jgi:putative redox protein
LAGFGSGGALCICEAAVNPTVAGVAAMATPADFEDWARNPRRLLLHARDVGVVKEPDFPADFDAWAQQLGELSSASWAPDVAPRPLLLMHGENDDLVPSMDARILADAHGDAELHIISGAGHELRHDPRAIAVLLGWLARQQNAVLQA